MNEHKKCIFIDPREIRGSNVGLTGILEVAGRSVSRWGQEDRDSEKVGSCGASIGGIMPLLSFVSMKTFL